jgi:serine/threonine-protein kinase
MVLALPKAGDVVAGKYRIEKVVGEGGMGIVYAAHHLVLDQRVALKLLLVDALRGAETVERFVREAQAAARLNSDHVVRVTDAGALDSGLPFLVMEYLEGCDLAELLRLDGPMAVYDVVDFTLQALTALAQAHAAGIVHRDLKPANLFVAARDDGSSLVKVLDFGISKQQSTKAQWKELTGKSVLGTPAYMSPEQLRSSKSVDARADLWSLGVVMYELLAGRPPFDGDTPGEIFAAILEQSPAPLRSLREDVPVALEAAVTRCLLRDPAARFQDVAELARALAPLGSGSWAHVVPLIDQALARSTRLTVTNSALVDAAVAAAVTSLPPPMYELPRVRGRSATFVTDKTMVAEVMPQPPSPRLRVTPGRIAAAVGTALAALVILTAGARHHAGTAATVGAPVAARAAEAERPARAAAKAPVEGNAVVMEAPAAPPAASADAPSNADAPASADAPGSADAPATGDAPRADAPAKKAAPKKSGGGKRPSESRPTFLKSWR